MMATRRVVVSSVEGLGVVKIKASYLIASQANKAWAAMQKGVQAAAVQRFQAMALRAGALNYYRASCCDNSIGSTGWQRQQNLICKLIFNAQVLFGGCSIVKNRLWSWKRAIFVCK
jgi:hypothetical protein